MMSSMWQMDLTTFLKIHPLKDNVSMFYDMTPLALLFLLRLFGPSPGAGRKTPFSRTALPTKP